MENISQLLTTAIPALFSVLLVLSLIVFAKALKLSKGTNCLFATLSLLGILFWALFLICLTANLLFNTHCNTNKMAGFMFFFLFSSYTFCEYGMNSFHENQLKITLCLDSFAILFYDFALVKAGLTLTTASLYIIDIIGIILVALNIVTIVCLRNLTPYMYMTIHGNKYHVYNEIEPSFGKDKECYTTIAIPLVEKADIEHNTFIKNFDNDDNTYVIKINDDTYEIRKDKLITVKNDGDICWLTITTNQVPISVMNREMVNILF